MGFYFTQRINYLIASNADIVYYANYPKVKLKFVLHHLESSLDYKVVDEYEKNSHR